MSFKIKAASPNHEFATQTPITRHEKPDSRIKLLLLFSAVTAFVVTVARPVLVGTTLVKYSPNFVVSAFSKHAPIPMLPTQHGLFRGEVDANNEPLNGELNFYGDNDEKFKGQFCNAEPCEGTLYIKPTNPHFSRCLQEIFKGTVQGKTKIEGTSQCRSNGDAKDEGIFYPTGGLKEGASYSKMSFFEEGKFNETSGRLIQGFKEDEIVLSDNYVKNGWQNGLYDNTGKLQNGFTCFRKEERPTAEHYEKGLWMKQKYADGKPGTIVQDDHCAELAKALSDKQCMMISKKKC